MPRRPLRLWPTASVVGALWALPANGQPAPPPDAPPSEPEPTAPASLEAQRAELEAQRKELEAQRKILAEQQAQLAAIKAELEQRPPPEGEPGEEEGDAAEEEALLAAIADDAETGDYERPETLDIYGFADVGWQKLFVPRRSFLHPLIETRANTFLVGNVNLFFDVKTSEDWRGLVELRITNTPHGQETSFATPTTAYERIDQRVLDSTSPNGRNQITLGSIVLERAWIQWSASDLFSVRVGSFFTPYGIWNIDHGTPTLISLLLPDSQVREYFPLRQLGVQALGSVFTESWELGYQAFVSNGRQVTQFDLTEDKAFGGRLFATHGAGGAEVTLGASGYYGTFTDIEKTVTSFDPFVVETNEIVAAKEWGLAADLAVDADAFRLRAEGVLHRVDFEDGKRAPIPFGQPGTLQPDRYDWNAYLLAAYQTPWLGIEPYLYGEVIHGPSPIGDTTLVPSAGFNIHFTPEAQLKAQYAYAAFVDVVSERDNDPSDNNFHLLTTRLVLAF